MNANQIFKTIAFIVGLALLFVTNPSIETHQQNIKNQFKKDNFILSTFGGGFLASKLPAYNDYWLFSTTEIEGTVVSIGAFGKVLVRDLDLG